MRLRRTPSSAAAAARATPVSPQCTAVEALASVLVAHLRTQFVKRKGGERPGRPDEAPAPILVQLDGMGADELLDHVDVQLRPPGERKRKPRWMVVRFDAWQYQRVQPPWWWLLAALDQQLRRDQRRRGLHHWLVGRARDWVWRAGRVLLDLWILVPVGLVALAAGVSSLERMSTSATKAASLAAALTALGVLARTIYRAIRHHLFLFSAVDQKALLRTRDPMADLQARYSFLLRSAGGPVTVLVANLDRCRSTYVVELLEGIQTLLKHRPRTGKEPPLVAFIFAADQTWLCNSFLEVYADAASSTADPGRPFGLDFLDKVFDYAFHLPLVPAMALRPDTERGEKHCSLAEKNIKDETQERAIRKLVSDAESAAAPDGRAPTPLQELRLAAVARLGQLEDLLGDSPCSDTTRQLDELVTKLDAAGGVRTGLRAGYCSQRTRQLLGGHAIDADPEAIRRLALWTILGLRWPLLARHLSTHPDHVDALRAGTVPSEVPSELAPVFTNGCARQVAVGWPEVVDLTPADIRRFTTMISSSPPALRLADEPRCDPPVGEAMELATR